MTLYLVVVWALLGTFAVRTWKWSMYIAIFRIGASVDACYWGTQVTWATRSLAFTRKNIVFFLNILFEFVAVWSHTRRREEQLPLSAWRLLREYQHLMTRWRGWWSQMPSSESPSPWTFIQFYAELTLFSGNLGLNLSFLPFPGYWGCNLDTSSVSWAVCPRRSDGTITTPSRWVSIIIICLFEPLLT